MNKRIRELCSQAISDVDGIQNPDTQNMYIPDCFAEKFAELIVNECKDLFFESSENNRLPIAVDDMIHIIDTHFGVDK
jgi:hypothetical protein